MLAEAPTAAARSVLRRPSQSNGHPARPLICVVATSILLATLVGPVRAPAQMRPELQRDALLDTLVTRALTDSTANGRQRAATRLLFMGLARQATPVAGVIPRAGEIYGRTGDEIIRESIIRLMPLQADTSAAVKFLVTVAGEPGHPPHGGVMEFDEVGSGTHAMLAVWGLQSMAAPGAEALRILVADDTVRDFHARALLDQWSRGKAPGG